MKPFEEYTYEDLQQLTLEEYNALESDEENLRWLTCRVTTDRTNLKYDILIVGKDEMDCVRYATNDMIHTPHIRVCIGDWYYSLSIDTPYWITDMKYPNPSLSDIDITPIQKYIMDNYDVLMDYWNTSHGGRLHTHLQFKDNK